ncbi:hypothetical protein ABH940_001695 [Streptacidiphilus sp. BW17]
MRSHRCSARPFQSTHFFTALATARLVPLIRGPEPKRIRGDPVSAAGP